MKDNSQDVVILDKYENPIDANIIKGILESNGIVAGVMAESLAQGLTMSPTCVMVMRHDLERAREILAAPAQDETPTEEDA